MELLQIRQSTLRRLAHARPYASCYVAPTKGRGLQHPDWGRPRRIARVSSASIETLAAQLDPPLTMIDVGARGGIDEAWTPLLPHLRAYGFDADAAECARLNAAHGSQQIRFVPLALGATPATEELHVTADPACSSLYPPDQTAAKNYRALKVITPTSSQRIAVDTIDRWAEREHVSNVSFLKLDTQGSELDVLRGATNTLRNVHAIRTEVEFNPIYRGQPLFGDVDAFLREHDFVLWRLANLCHYTLNGQDEQQPFPDREVFASTPSDVLTVDFVAGAGRLFWAEAFFVRRELAEGTPPLGEDAATRAACVLAMLGLHELAAICR
jgi:FkbM family methyltransferase